MAVVDLELLDEVDLRMMRDESIVEALELADGLAALTLRGDGQGAEASRLAAAYQQARETTRQLRRALAVAVGG